MQNRAVEVIGLITKQAQEVEARTAGVLAQYSISKFLSWQENERIHYKKVRT